LKYLTNLKLILLFVALNEADKDIN